MTERPIHPYEVGHDAWPLDYTVYPIGWYIGLNENSDESEFTIYQITNRSFIPPDFKIDTTNWLLTAGSSYNAGDISDLFEMENGVLGVFALGFADDRPIEWEVKSRGAMDLYGMKNRAPIRVTSRDSPHDKPMLTICSWGEYVPQFVLRNNSKYTPRFVRLHWKGYRYQLAKMPGGFRPRNWTPVAINRFAGVPAKDASPLQPGALGQGGEE